MPSEIQLRAADMVGDPDGNLYLRWENTINAPIVSATDRANGQGVSDTYELTFTVSGGSVICDVVCGTEGKNPYAGLGKAVVADGVTPNVSLIPGVSIVISASVSTGWEAVVSYGAKMTSGGVTTDYLNVGRTIAGESSTQRRIAAVNVGDADSGDTTVDSVPSSYWKQTGAGDIVDLVDNDTDDTREHTAAAGEYEVTFQNWQDGGGGYKIADVYVDGPQGSGKAIESALFDGSTRYQYGVTGYDNSADLLQGLSLILADSTDDPSAVTVTVVVADGDQWVELAPDDSGSPGAWQAGPLELTELGEADGTITAGGSCYFWQRWTLPDDATPGDLRQWRPSLRGITV